MTAPENLGNSEPLVVPGKYQETLPLNVDTIADGTILGLFGSRYLNNINKGKWDLNVRDFTDLVDLPYIPDSEHLPPEIGKITTEVDPHPLDSSESYTFAHQIAAGWLVDRGLRITQRTAGTRLYGSIVCSLYVTAKSPSE